MKVLIGCECSGRSREAFKRHGHDAWSCDLQESEDNSPYHIVDDVRAVARRPGWDLFIYHSPCTYTANSGAKWLYIDGRQENGRDESRWEGMRQGVAMFLDLWSVDIPRVCAEWPIIHEHAQALLGIEPDQYIQPWQFGDPEQKATALRLRNLPRLVPTHRKQPDLFALPAPDDIQQSVWREAPGPERQRNRSRTFPGIANAFATQWGRLTQKEGGE